MRKRLVGAIVGVTIALASATASGTGEQAWAQAPAAPAAPTTPAAPAPSAAPAAEPASPPIRLELNRLESDGDNCRAYFLIDNSTGTAHRSFKVDLFVLDTDGVAAKRVVLELGPVAAKKTVIRLFDFKGVPCTKFGKVLLNDVLGCESATGEHQDCLAGTTTDSKTSVPFVK